MPVNKPSTPSDKKNISIGGDVVDSVVIVGDNNTVNQTIIQKFFNIFKSDAQTLEQRNRRILLNHVENAWIKGVLDASLHGAALLDLGIKQDPEAVTKYPWAIQKESTKETLPAGTSMLEIFDSIGMGRSLLILGAPGSGKTTMLLELARGLIARAREDVTQPIPMVFNLASWTEKLTLADWLAQELNNLYSVPRKTAPDWVQGNKLLLLLDGLDEVRQESRAKCVEAINEFRKHNGLTSLAVCSRSQDYADLKAKLSFEGAIEVQPLTQEQIAEFLNRFGDELVGIKQILKKDNALHEMAETPLFLSIMLMAYRDKRDVEILVSGDEGAMRKQLLDTYIERMFNRQKFLTNKVFRKQSVFRWLAWLGQKMLAHNKVPFLLESIQQEWLSEKQQWSYILLLWLIFGPMVGLIIGIVAGANTGVISGITVGFIVAGLISFNEISLSNTLTWNWKGGRDGVIAWLIFGLFGAFLGGINFGLIYGTVFGLIIALVRGLKMKPIIQTTHPGQIIIFSARNSLLSSLVFGLCGGLTGGFAAWMDSGLSTGVVTSGLTGALFGSLIGGLAFGGLSVIQHHILRIIIALSNCLPWRLVPFLDHCVDLIFLRRVGGGYIFIHRLLMEHFAEMYVEPTK